MIFNMLIRINSILTRITGVLMSLSVAMMAVLIMMSVIVRNLMGFSFQWIVDVNRLIFIWMCFLGIVYVSDKDVLIRFDIIDKHFSPIVHRIFTILRYFASVVLFGIMVKSGIEVSEFAGAQVFSTIPVSTRWLYIPVIVAGCILTFQTVVKMITMLSRKVPVKQN